MKTLLLALALTVVAANAGAQPVPYETRVLTIDSRVLRQDRFFIDKDDARARAADILRNGWVITTQGGTHEEHYPPHSIVKVIVFDQFPQPPQCPPDCPSPHVEPRSSEK